MTPWQLAKTTEHSHQRAFFAWLRMCGTYGFSVGCNENAYKSQRDAIALYSASRDPARPELFLFHAIPNGAALSSKAQAGKLVSEGLKKGVCDTFLPVSIPECSGLYIEFKKPTERFDAKGGVSEEQRNFIQAVQYYKFRAEVAYSWIEAANIVMHYLAYYEEELVDIYQT